MRIATFNVNSIRSRLDIVIAWLTRHEPDALCIQETKVVDADFPALAFREAGYHVVFRGEKAYNGVALASREPPRNVCFGLDDGEPPDATRLVAARVAGVHIVNTYVPQGRDITHEMYAYKLRWFQRLKAWFDRHYSTRSKLLWTGDLNVAPEPIDIHNAEQQANHVCYHADVRAAFADTVSWGFTDIFRRHHPEAGQYSFFDYRTPNAVQRRMGWRIDHLLATPALARKSTDAWIDLEPRHAPKPSDHTVVVADFDP
jgi:exodeoxyribonuclease-3